MESGTQVEVTDELRRESQASADYLADQAKSKKSARPTDAREPGAP